MLNAAQICFQLKLVENVILIKKQHPNDEQNEEIEVLKGGKMMVKFFHGHKKNKINRKTHVGCAIFTLLKNRIYENSIYRSSCQIIMGFYASI